VRLFKAAAVAAFFVACAGCAQQRASQAVPAPAGAIAAAFLPDGHVAILAGNDFAKSVSVIDMGNGALVHTFGVTKEARGLASDGGDVIVAIGGIARGGAFGAVERWHLDGTKVRVVPLPARSLAITQSIDGEAYVLLAGNGAARAALPLTIAGLRTGRALPLEAGAHDLQQCKIGSQPYLVYADGRGAIVVRGTESATVLHSADVGAQSAGCGDDSRIYAISKGFAARSLAVLSLPSMLRLSSSPLAADARELYSPGNGRLIALNASPQTASLESVDAPGGSARAAQAP
jgi:hypothetical protein